MGSIRTSIYTSELILCSTIWKHYVHNCSSFPEKFHNGIQFDNFDSYLELHSIIIFAHAQLVQTDHVTEFSPANSGQYQE